MITTSLDAELCRCQTMQERLWRRCWCASRAHHNAQSDKSQNGISERSSQTGSLISHSPNNARTFRRGSHLNGSVERSSDSSELDGPRELGNSLNFSTKLEGDVLFYCDTEFADPCRAHPQDHLITSGYILYTIT